TRAQGFTIATYRAETRHHVRLGADAEGKLLTYLHEAWELSSRPDNYNVSGTTSTAVMYGYGAIATKVNVVNADRNTPGFMRWPPEVPYMYALESAMDELACALKMDPVALRRANDTMKDPASDRVYSSRSLIQCFEQGSEAFGWKDRNPEPQSMRDGDWLVGWGCATAAYPTQITAAAVRVRLSLDGSVLVQVAAHEIGNGIYTVLAQTAAERLGAPLDLVRVEVGDSALPPGPVAGGSNTTASTTSVLVKACDVIRAKLFQAAAATKGENDAQAIRHYALADGRVYVRDEAIPLGVVFHQMGQAVLEEYAESVPRSLPPETVEKLYSGQVSMTGGPKGEKLAFAFGAQFVEVRVHARTRDIRVPRALGAFAAGKIVNPRTARSQLMGGVIWGLSSALHEATELDERTARYVNTDLADYLIPVNADIQTMMSFSFPKRTIGLTPSGSKAWASSATSA
ncbi:MAG: molybdopterin-dependent oxidoreductase, partial [Hyphomicrobiales bacterium]|nr:molybdopterin-dependent oxidoreductase [Hyphomicrobiales bacterium]